MFRYTNCSAAPPGSECASTPMPEHRKTIAKAQAQGFTAFKTGPASLRPPHIIESKVFVDHVAEEFATLRAVGGSGG